MTIQKANFNKKDILNFKKQYNNGKIETETMNNIFYSCLRGELPQTDFVKQYLSFWFDKENKGAIGVIQLLISSYSQNILKKLFDKPDFIFKVNRTYKNYIFQYEDIFLLGSTQLEVVINNNELQTPKKVEKIFIFNHQFNQLILDSIAFDYNNLANYEKKSLNLAIKDKLIDKQFKFQLSIPTKPDNVLKLNKKI